VPKYKFYCSGVIKDKCLSHSKTVGIKLKIKLSLDLNIQTPMALM
jgi:hypothetical protein